MEIYVKIALMEARKPVTETLEGAWLLAFLVSNGAVGKWLNPVPLKGNSLTGYVGSNPTSASRKDGNHAASTMTVATSRTNHNP